MTQRRWEMRGNPQIVQGNSTTQQCALCRDNSGLLFTFKPLGIDSQRVYLCEPCLVEATVWIRECVEEDD